MFSSMRRTAWSGLLLAAVIFGMVGAALPNGGAAQSDELQLLPFFKPDLVITGPANGGTAVTVTNIGHGATTSRFVVLVRGNGILDNLPVNELLGPGESINVPFVFGCPAQRFFFFADVHDLVVESNETNNKRSITADNC
jgi:hypothetical protein